MITVYCINDFKIFKKGKYYRAILTQAGKSSLSYYKVYDDSDDFLNYEYFHNGNNNSGFPGDEFRDFSKHFITLEEFRDGLLDSILNS